MGSSGRAYTLQQEVIDAYENYQFHQVYQKVHHFCSIELGGFYLDIIKDRQYTTQANSLARLSAQTAMFHVAEALVRWLAPILSFTADEIWQHLPGERADSVFLETWYQGVYPLSEQDVMTPLIWQQIMEVRDVVKKEMEKLRAQDIIGFFFKC